MAKTYTIDGVDYEEWQVEDWYNCKFCDTNITEAGILHEDQFGTYFCEGKECVWELIGECHYVEVENVTDDGEEE